MFHIIDHRKWHASCVLVKHNCVFVKRCARKYEAFSLGPCVITSSCVITSYCIQDLAHYAQRVFVVEIIIMRYQYYNHFLSVKYWRFLGTVSTTLHWTQAKRNLLRGFKSTSRLFDDAITFLKTMSTLEGCEYLVSCYNHSFKEVERTKKKKR